MQKCTIVWNIELTAVMEQDFDSVEEAANQLEASDKSRVKEISNQRTVFSTVKLLKEDKADGLRPKEDQGASGSGKKGDQANV